MVIFNDIVYLTYRFALDIVLLHGLVSVAMLLIAICNGHVRSSGHCAGARLDAVDELCLETHHGTI